ncbi:MAG: BrnT family toxin [Luteibacter sp.]
MTTHNAIEPLLPSSRTHDYRAALEMLCALDRSAYEHRTLKEGANWERRTQLYEFVQGRVQMNRIAGMDLRVFALNTLLKGGFRIAQGLGHPGVDSQDRSWDPPKNGRNIFKHGLSFDEITQSPTFGTLTFFTPHKVDGTRAVMFSTLDTNANARLAMPMPGMEGEVYLLTIATMRGENYRFISALHFHADENIRGQLAANVAKLNLAPLERDVFINHCESRIRQWLAPRVTKASGASGPDA